MAEETGLAPDTYLEMALEFVPRKHSYEGYTKQVFSVKIGDSWSIERMLKRLSLSGGLNARRGDQKPGDPHARELPQETYSEWQVSFLNLRGLIQNATSTCTQHIQTSAYCMNSVKIMANTGRPIPNDLAFNTGFPYSWSRRSLLAVPQY
jgi:hypothetical protein